MSATRGEMAVYANSNEYEIGDVPMERQIGDENTIFLLPCLCLSNSLRESVQKSESCQGTRAGEKEKKEQ